MDAGVLEYWSAGRKRLYTRRGWLSDFFLIPAECHLHYPLSHYIPGPIIEAFLYPLGISKTLSGAFVSLNSSSSTEVLI